MSEVATFSCDACGRKIPWRPEIAGKQGKCKCGHLLLIPRELAPAVGDDLYDLSELAADAERAAKELPPTIVEASPATAPKARTAGTKAKGAKPGGGGKAPASKPFVEKPVRNDDGVLIDKQRDVIVPISMAVIGGGLLLAFYASKLSLGAGQIMQVGIGLSVIAAIEAVLMVVFALVIAGPLGVGFGDFRTAWYKFIAVAILTDGVTGWVDNWIRVISGGFGGFMGYATVGMVTAFAIYYVAFMYLFGLDPNETYSTVGLLGIFYRIVRLVLVLVVLPAMLGLGGNQRTALGIPAPAELPNSQRDEVEAANSAALLYEAREYMKKYGRDAEAETIDGWYGAGAKNVWYEVTRSPLGRIGLPFRFVVELPADPAGREKCFGIGHAWYKHLQMEEMDLELKDKGDPYLMVYMRE